MTQTYKVQVSMNQAHIVESGFVWKQGDFGFNIEIEVLDFDTTGATPQIIFRKSTGAVEATQITRAGNKFTYAIRGTELDTPGPCVCDLKLKDSTTKRVSTASFKYFVIPDTMDGLEQEASSYSDTIAQMINDVFNQNYSKMTWVETGSDLNNYTTPGDYAIPSDTRASSLVNAPVAIQGILSVLSTSNSLRIQYYIARDGNIYSRSNSGGSFTAWKRLVQDNELKAALGVAPDMFVDTNAVNTNITAIFPSGKNYYTNYYVVAGNSYKIFNKTDTFFQAHVVADVDSYIDVVGYSEQILIPQYNGYLRVYCSSATSSTEIPIRIINMSNISKSITACEDSIFSKIITFNDFSITGYIKPNGTLDATNNFRATDYIELESDQGYIKGKLKAVKGNLAIYSFYDAAYNLISNDVGPSTTQDVEVIYNTPIPAGAKYIRYSTRLLYLKEEDAIQHITLARIQTRDYVKEFFVGYGRNDDVTYFDSLVDCLWACDAIPDVKKVVHINAGTYDVLDELGGMEHVNQYTYPDTTPYDEGVQPWLTNIHIIGHGQVILNFNLDDSVEFAQYWLFSCLNVRGNVEIENIEIHSSNCRYAIHDESSSNFPNTIHKYKNVRCYQNVYAGTKGGQAVGSGFSSNSNVEVINCYFEARRSQQGWTCHANDNCSLLFENSIMRTVGDQYLGLRLSQNGQTSMTAKIINCVIRGGIELRAENSSPSYYDDTKVDIINTNIETINCGYTDIRQPVVSFNSINGTRTVLLETNN